MTLEIYLVKYAEGRDPFYAIWLAPPEESDPVEVLDKWVIEVRSGDARELQNVLECCSLYEACIETNEGGDEK